MFALKSTGSGLSYIANHVVSLRQSFRFASYASRRYPRDSRDQNKDSRWQQKDSRWQQQNSREQHKGSRWQQNDSREQHNDSRRQQNNSREQYNDSRWQQKDSREQYTAPREYSNSTALQYNVEDNIPRFTKSEETHSEFRKMMLNLSVKKRRDDLRKMVLEGKRLINDAIDADVKIESIYFTSDTNLSEIHDLDRIVQEQGTKLVKVLYKDMKLFSSLVTSPGCMAVAHRPDNRQISESGLYCHEVPLTIICDNVRDPGNIGTIIRTGAASGIKQIISTKGSCDIWNSKVVKSSCGAHFRLPIYESSSWSDLLSEFPWLKDTDFYLADSNLKSESKSYFELDPFTSEKPKDKVLIICNEAHGPSSECEEFIYKLESPNFTRIHIPLGSNVESLNSAIAASVFMFEFRKQFTLKGDSN